MSGIHMPFTRTIVLSPSTPKTSGGSFDLGDGQIGLFITESTNRGAKAVSSYQKPNKKYFLEVGTGIKTNQAGSTTKGMRTHWFSPKDVEEVLFTPAKEATQAHLYLGYDGLDKTKSLKLAPGETAEISITLTGEPIAFYGYKNGKYTGTFVMKAPEPDECQETCLTAACYDSTLAVIEQIKERDFRPGIKLKDLIEVHPVIDCLPGVLTAKTTANFYCLSLCDSGDDAALGLVQAQVPGYEVVRDSYVGTTSTYKVLGGASVPSAYLDYKVAIKTDCGEDCDAGYTSLGEGWFTVLSDNDGGADDSATILTALEEVYTAAVVTSVTKISGGQVTGKYVVLFTEKVDLDTATTIVWLQDIEEVENLCVITANTTTAWAACGTCERTFDYYYIDLEDDECGSRLAELQAAYPQLTIAPASSLINGVPDGTDLSNDSEITEILESEVIGDCRRRYFTTVTTNVVCDECHPDQFSSDAPDAFEFEMWKKYVITGGKVAAVDVSEDVVGAEGTYESVSGTTDNNGVGATFDVVIDAERLATVTVVKGGSNYQVGDIITIDGAGELGGGVQDLTLTITAITQPSEDSECVCGISFKAKYLRECAPVDIESATVNGQIEINVSGGEMIGYRIGYPNRNALKWGAFPVTRVSRAFSGVGWGEDFVSQEAMSYDYFLSITTPGSIAERYLRGVRTKLENCKLYSTFSLKIKNQNLSQGFSQVRTEYLRYNFIVDADVAHLYRAFFNNVASGNSEAVVVYE